MLDQDSHVTGDFDLTLESGFDEIDNAGSDALEYRRRQLEDEVKLLARRRIIDLGVIAAFAIKRVFTV